jgi:RNA polymerase sigma-70 factor (ECF subfamily)
MTSSSRAAESDASVVARIAGGDERALGELYDRHGTLAFSLARAILGDTAEAEEATEDAFLQVWRAAATFDATRASVAAWLTMVVRSRALDRLRARRRHERTIASAVATQGETVHGATPLSADRAVEADEAGARVRAVLSELPEPQRRCLELAYFEGLTHSEIAELLRLPLGTVKTRIRAGMDKLRATLAAYDTVR